MSRSRRVSASRTTVPREFLEQEAPDASFTLLRDPDAVEPVIGERVATDLGVWLDDRHGDPIENIDGWAKAHRRNVRRRQDVPRRAGGNVTVLP